MIEYDYTLHRDLKSQSYEYKPSFAKKIGNVSKLKGRNSSGKTTLLNFIAISAYGLDHRVDMIPELQQKIKYLYESEDSDFEFEMVVDNVHSKTKLKFKTLKQGHISGNKHKSIQIEESIDNLPFESLNKEQFLKKYRLIYDMPYRPMKRIQELVRETEHAEKNCRDDVDRLRTTLRTMKREIDRSKDQKSIEELEKKLQGSKEELASAERQLDIKKIFKNKLECLYNAVNVCEKHKKYVAALKNQMKNEKNKTEKDSKDRRACNEYDAKLREAREHLEKAKSNMVSSIEPLKKLDLDSKILFMWCDFSVDIDSWLNTKKVPVDSISKSAQSIEHEIFDKYHSSELKAQNEKKDILIKIMGILQPHLDNGMLILDKDMKSFFKELGDEVKSINKNTEIYKHAVDAETAVKNTRNYVTYADKLISELGPKPNYNDDNSEFLKELATNVDKLYQEFSSAIDNALPFGITEVNYVDIIEEICEDPSLEKYIDSTAAHLYDVLLPISKEIDTLDKKISGENGLIKIIGNYDGRLEILKNAKDHEMKEYNSELAILEKELQIISEDLANKHKILELVANDKLGEEKGQTQFLELVWLNIGRRLGTVQHVGKNYDVLAVNMKKGFIETKEGIRINFEGMGTGESQRAYLMGILNNTDKRTLIALFDEVEHMDPFVIKSIQDKLSELYTQGKLLIGLMAAPGESVEAINYESA